MSGRTRAALVVAAGFAVGAVIAAAIGASAHDGAVVILLAAGGSAGVAIVGSLLVHRLHSRSLRVQVLIIVLASIVAIVAGVLVAAQAMFISGHDVGVLAVILSVSAAVSVAAAVQLGTAFERSTVHVGEMARQLVAPAGVAPLAATTSLPPPVVTGELQRLAAQLAAARADLDAARARAEALDASRRELVAWVSHDLRSPIASIRAMAEALDDHVVDDQASIERYHRSMCLESERLGALVDDLFELSRISAGAIDTDQPLVPLGELVTEVTAAAEVTAATREVRIVNLLDEGSEAMVPMSDFRRVLRNLLDNAVRHTRAGGTVVLDGGIIGRTAVVHVTDECGGIPEEDMGRLFDVAFRGDVARSRDQGGGGLGLAIAKGLLEAHHGSIVIVNHSPGCRFTVRLPVVSR